MMDVFEYGEMELKIGCETTLEQFMIDVLNMEIWTLRIGWETTSE